MSVEEGTVTETTPVVPATPEVTQAPAETPAATAPPETTPQALAPELSLKEKLHAIADKSPKTTPPKGPDGKFLKTGPQGGDNSKAPTGTTNVAAEGEKPIYVPNFALKVMKEDREIPEWARGLVKDEASEKQVKEIFSKAYGMELMQPKHQQREEQLKETVTENWAIKKDIHEARQLYQKGKQTGDLAPFFEKIRVDKQIVLQWLASEIQFEQLPPEQQTRIRRAREADARAEAAEQRAMQAEGQYEHTQATQLVRQLESVLTRPDVSQIASAYDSRTGRKPGDFQALVIDHGEWVYEKSQGKVLLSPEQAVEAVMERFGHQAPVTAPQAPPAAPAAVVQTKAPAAPTPPVIPTIAAGAQSPTARSGPRSIDDLRKRGQEMAAANRT